MDYTKALHRMDERELRAVVLDRKYSPQAREAAARILVDVQAINDRIRGAENEAVREARIKHLLAQYRPKGRGHVDSRSLKHAGINAGGAGGILATVWAVGHVYGELRREGLAPTPGTILRVLGTLPEWAQVAGAWVIGVAIAVFAVTLIDKARRTY